MQLQQTILLKFSDEFNVDGAPDATKWSYDLGTGDNMGKQ
jgi:hypothetical protein